MTTFYKNYVSLCAEKGVSLSAAAVAVGLSRTSPNGWKKGKLPSDTTIAKLVAFFGCTEDELLTEKKKSPAPERVELNSKYFDLSEKNKALVDALIEQLAMSQSED